ncbi:integrase core domain-containing protein, partial [Klebsiella oxytoca]|uniref:integrase core domain-containing protein n=1 Tax=Klebsiella oxytoca TaxID=571 RepID=UPI001F5CCD36
KGIPAAAGIVNLRYKSCPEMAGQDQKPQQNAYIERYNRTVRYDWLGQYLFSTLSELQDYATRWQWFYNHERPNMALNGFTPMQHILQRMT